MPPDAPNHALVRAGNDVTPEAWMLFLHGILGSGPNLRTIARRFVQARPRWGAVLVDLRMHGSSQDFAPPHTVEAAARDLFALDPRVPGPVRAVWGHSFGGKVALQYAYAAEGGHELEHLVIVDSNPGARPGGRGSESTLRVVDTLQELPPWFPTREAFVDELQRRGYELPIAQWLAMNLERGEHGVRFGLDVSAIHALLDDYFARDLWHVVEDPPGRCRVHVINGGRSNVYDAADRARVEALAQRSDRVSLHVVAEAGHWVHADAPDALLDIMIAAVDPVTSGADRRPPC
ncbi:MAG: alpha/beta fold hydrolase [Deltaproteobacteria bacterium]|nr:alpha/beta fold hydrolase [Deltaproteobacteria bacterium]